MHFAVLLFACLSSQAGSQAVPRVIEFPLTDLDVKLARTAIAPAISIKSRTNESCLLTQRYVPASSGCTWRTSRRCFTKPVIRKVPVYDEGCLVDEMGVHSRDCKEVLRPVPVIHSLKVCNSSASPVCSTPCPDCALHCRATQSFWSETSHKIKIKVMTRKVCLEGEEKECSGPIMREEMETIEEVENHYEKKGRVCAPINCKFKVPDGNQHCAENKDTVLVQLRTKLCTVCEPKLVDKVESQEECEEVSTRDCDKDPLSKPWKKFCTNREIGSRENFNSSYNKHLNDKYEEPRSSKGALKTNVIFDSLFSKSLNPINSLIKESLKTKLHSYSSEEKISEETKTQKPLSLSSIANNEVNSKFKNRIPVTSLNSSFIPVLNNRNSFFTKNNEEELAPSFITTNTSTDTISKSRVNSKIIETTSMQTIKSPTSVSSITTSKSLTNSLRKTKQTTLKPTPSVATILYSKSTRNPSTKHFTELTLSVPNTNKTEASSKRTTPIPQQLTTAVPTTSSVLKAKTPTSIPFLTSASPAMTSSQHPSLPVYGHKVLLSEFLKRCFQDFRDPSCDFSQTASRPRVESQTTEGGHKITISPITTTQSLEKKVQEFNSLFELTTPTTNTETTTTISSTEHSVDKQAEKIKAKVQAELRAAFFG